MTGLPTVPFAYVTSQIKADLQPTRRPHIVRKACTWRGHDLRLAVRIADVSRSIRPIRVQYLPGELGDQPVPVSVPLRCTLGYANVSYNYDNKDLVEVIEEVIKPCGRAQASGFMGTNQELEIWRGAAGGIDIVSRIFGEPDVANQSRETDTIRSVSA
jgi:hypothetical protein